MSFRDLLDSVEQYYSRKLREHGPTARGVDWSSLESQNLRFEQLMKVCDTSKAFSVNDYGCGYGALADYLNFKGFTFRYRGFDISPSMIAMAAALHLGIDYCEFVNEESRLSVADYTLASGIFNVKLQASVEEWQAYMLDTVGRLAGLSDKGFAFNALTVYSDPDRRRPDLYYADPLYWFDHCKRHISRFVTLVHDYPLFEFTILVRK